jgi:hypothetical protein
MRHPPIGSRPEGSRRRRTSPCLLRLAHGLALLGLAAGAHAAATAERDPKTFEELQRQSGHVWDIAAHAGFAARPIHTGAYQRALDEHRSGHGDLRHDLEVSWGEFLSGTGEPILTLSLDRPVDDLLAPGTRMTIFGELVDASGKVLTGFEAEDEVELSAGRAVVDVPLRLPLGAVRAVLGVARRGKPVWLVEQPMAVTAIDPHRFGLSRPVLSLDVHPLATPQHPDDPFSFGGLRVVPRGGVAFRSGDAPWLFAVVRVPGSSELDVPKLGAVLTITGPEGFAPRRYPIDAPTPTPLRGFATQWGLGVPLPVNNLPAGDYTAALAVTDKVAGVQETSAASFHIAP